MIVNNVIFKIVFIFIFLNVLILFFPSLAEILSLLSQDRDVLFNSKKYIKKEVLIDSLRFIDMDGSDTEDVYGYSKDLNNYVIEIQLGSVNDESVAQDLNMDNEGNVKKKVWYRNESKVSYLANEEDRKFPFFLFLYNSLKLTFLWIVYLSSTIFLYRMRKKIMFNKKTQKL